MALRYLQKAAARSGILPGHLLWACLPLAVVACRDTNSQKDPLLGRWEALEVTEEEQPLEVDPSEIRFTFFPDGTYRFHSTLDYREAGRYHLRNQYLLTTDTLAAAASEKAVEVLQLHPDTLRLRMMENEKERILVLTKTDSLTPPR